MGDLVLHLHKGCAESLLRQAELEQRQEQEADTGTYGRGLLGALLGGLIGAVVWAVVLYFGYMAALVGLLIGWLTEVLYRKLGGKNGKVKILILLVAALLSVVVGTLGADALTLVQMISDGELYGSYGDILPFIGELLVTDSEYLTGTLLNIGLGMVFALLGMFGVLYQTHKETQKVKMKEIK
jgi:cyanate permease